MTALEKTFRYLNNKLESFCEDKGATLVDAKFVRGIVWNIGGLGALAGLGVILNIIIAVLRGPDALGIFNQVFDRFQMGVDKEQTELYNLPIYQTLTCDEVEGHQAIDTEQYHVELSGDIIVLPRKEFELLSLLASNPGKVFSRERIMDRIWGDSVVVGGRTIDVHIRKIREKIGEERIRTIKGVGYKFEIEE